MNDLRKQSISIKEPCVYVVIEFEQELDSFEGICRVAYCTRIPFRSHSKQLARQVNVVTEQGFIEAMCYYGGMLAGGQSQDKTNIVISTGFDEIGA